ncbi:MAG: hypothetical protein OXF72_03480 [Gammaproteobacteria bacterium]|nr:hypothetical protein [Gammaproteobacteria bacterium]MCY4278756.1 hypothetical protein [Gammaproteobacteria bacterium]
MPLILRSGRQTRLASLDRSLIEAAQDLSGRPLAVAWDITLPLIALAMLAGFVLCRRANGESIPAADRRRSA